jgi:hypothetical protein
MAQGPDTSTAAGWSPIDNLMFLYVANGVTTIRDMAGSPVALALRARVAMGKTIGPRLYVATPQTIANGVTDPAKAAKIPVDAKAAGYDLIKLAGIEGEALDSLAAAARRVGIPIAGHVPGNGHSPQALQRAMDAGYASIEHLIGFIKGYDSADWMIDSTKLAETAAALRRAGVWNCPTLMILAGNFRYVTGDTMATWPEMRYYSPRLRNLFTAHDSSAGTAERRQKAAQKMATARRIVKALQDGGAGLLLGTDDAVAGVPGFLVHRELVELVHAGLTPYQALATGTRNVAAYFGMLDSAGTVGLGKRADLILLTGNPLRDIRQTTQRAGVMVGGRWLPQAELERRLATLEGTVGGN